MRIILSLLILFHLAVIVTLANGSSYLGRSLGPYLLPYANTLGLNCTWNFFSPDPAHTMYYKIRVFFEDKDGNDLKDPEEIFYPAEKSHIVINSSKRRTLYAMRFLTLDPDRLKTIMGPWLCRSHPGATRVRMDHFVDEIPYLDKAVKQSDQSLSELVSEKNFISAEVRCGEGGEGGGQ